jgi:hypothetical protein
LKLKKYFKTEYLKLSVCNRSETNNFQFNSGTFVKSDYDAAPEETGTMGREVESRPGIGWKIKKL